MAAVTVVKNQFKPNQDRLILTAVQGMSICEIRETHNLNHEIVIMVNGKESKDETYRLKRDDSVLLMTKVAGGGGGSKGVLRMIGMIVIMVAAIAVTGGAAAGFMASTFGASAGTFAAGTIGASLLGAAIGIGGSLLLNAVLPPAQPDITGGSNISESNTYGWGQQNNSLGEGQVIPILYGTHRITPQIINRNRIPSENSEKLHLLFGLCQGPIDSVTEIQINGEPLEGFEGTKTSIRLGTPDQDTVFSEDVINDEGEAQNLAKHFQVSSEKVINQEIQEDDAYLYFDTTGNSVNAVTVALIFPTGLFRLADNGNYKETVALIGLEYRKVGDQNWTEVAKEKYFVTQQRYVYDSHLGYSVLTDVEVENSDYNVLVVKASRSRPVRYAKNIFFDEPGHYEFRVRQNRKSTSNRVSDDCYVDYINEIIYDEFTYPGTALLALSALASEKVSGGAPSISCLASKHFVTINGESKSANNPAWACYDLLTNPLYGRGVSESRMRYDEFSAWADFCEDQNLEINIYLDSVQTLYDTLNIISTNGRGSIVQRGSEFGVVWDGVSPMVQPFNVANIVKDSLKITYLESENRANQIDVTYFDRDQDYARKIVSVRLDETSLADEIRSASLVLTGCTSRDQATRHAKYQLNSNKHLIRIVEFEADIDAIACVVGDVIGVQHDVPQWGYGGRVVSATAGGLVLDREVPLEVGQSYEVVVRKNDDSIEIKKVEVTSTGESDTLTLVNPWTIIPEQGDIYSFGEIDKATKLFRVTRLARSQDMRVKITGVEYREEIYDDSLSVPDYEQESDLILGAESLRLDDVFQYFSDGSVQANISVSWRGNATSYTVIVEEKTSSGPGEQRSYTTGNREYLIESVKIGATYLVTVKPSSTIGASISGEVVVEIDPPSQIEGLSAEVSDNFVLLRWNVPDSEMPIRSYEIYKGPTFEQAILFGEADNTFKSIFETVPGTYTYWVLAVDGAGRKGMPSSVEVTLDTLDNFEALGELHLQGLPSYTDKSIWSYDRIVIPVNTTETWNEWWNGVYGTDSDDVQWQQFIEDGYGEYLSPDSAISGQYDEVVDLGVLYPNDVTLRVSETIETLFGDSSDLSVQRVLSTSSDGTSFEEQGSINQVTVSNVQYVKLSYHVTAPQAAISIVPLIEVTAKKIEEVGTFDIANTSTGKFVTFKKSFADVETIQITPKGTSSRVAVYDFDDVPNPTGFTVKLFDVQGTSVMGGGSYLVKGI